MNTERKIHKRKMETKMSLCFLICLCLVKSVFGAVSYDYKALMINGQRKILISGSIHYPRSTPQMWPDLIQKAKDGGIDVIQTYVFWNGHEPSPGNFNFQGRYDLVQFIKLVQKAGLYVHLRIGPFVCAEWNFGGFPVWLKYVPGMQFRTDNEPFKSAMKGFTEKIVNMMKAENLYQPQGGPIILSQIENEYGPVEWEIGAPGKAYTQWAAQMATSLNTGVPWVMCKQDKDVPDPIIDTCNGFYCEGFWPTKQGKPKMWTELWTGWFTETGAPTPYRPVEDIAYAVARFIQNGGSFVNYYMYHGGSNFGRTSGMFVSTSYDYDAPIDEYGMVRQPKWGHLKELHKVIKQCESALVTAAAVVTPLGNNLEAHVFDTKTGACAAFLANYDDKAAAKVKFQNLDYDLPPWSISILPDCKTAVYNTARVNTPGLKMKMTPAIKDLKWEAYKDEIPAFDAKNPLASDWLKEQLNVTRDWSDYLWYMTEVTVPDNEGFLKSGKNPTLTVASAGHAMLVFVNGQFYGKSFGTLANTKFTYSQGVKLNAGINKISLLSASIGLANVGTHFETFDVGILGPVTLDGMNSGKWDLSKSKWAYKVGLKGESSYIYGAGGSSVQWNGAANLDEKSPLTWYRTSFNAPDGTDPVALDMSSMGKGQMWVNGESVGRHWTGNVAKGNCGNCNYAGLYGEKKCLSDCNAPSQKWFHVPRSWLKPTGNSLVVLEEWGGNPSWISLVKRTI